MPVIVHTRVGTIREVVGTAFRLGPDGSETPLKAGDRVLTGDVIVTRQDSLVEIVEDAVVALPTTGSQTDRVIAAIEAGEPGAAPGAGLTGGAGSSLSDGFRVGRISEVLGTDAALPATELLSPPALIDIDSQTVPTTDSAVEPLPTISVDAPALGSDSTPLIVGRTNQAVGSTVTLTVTDATGVTQTFFAVVLADGSYSADVPLPLADGLYTVVATVSTPGGLGVNASDDGLIDSSAPRPTITLDPIAGNDVLNVDEAGDPAITLSGRVGGDARPGDTVTVSVGGQDFVTTVRADGSFAVLVPGSLLAGGAAAGVTAVVTSVDDAGNSASISTTRPYTLNVAPVAVNDAMTQLEDGPAVRADLTPGTAGQDNDPEGDLFSVTGVAAAGAAPVGGVGSAVAGSWGTLVVAADGSYVYTPGSAAQSLGGGDSATDVFTYQVTDSEGNTATASLTISLTGANDAALITGSLAGQVVEDGQLVATGRVQVNDADSGESAIQPLAGVAGRYGSFSIDSDGVWTYRLDNPSPDVQALAAGQTVTERFTVTSSDGSTNVVVVSVLGTDDAAVVSVGTGSVVEDSRPTATGTLVASDIDNPAPSFVAAVLAGTWGELTLLASGAWSYTLGDAAQALTAGQVVNEPFTVNLSDGSFTTVTITVTGTDDAPVITDGIGAVIEDTRPTATGALSASDIDNPALAFVAGVQAGQYGELTLQSDGQWSYTLGDAAQPLAEGQVVTDAFTVLLDDGSSTTVTITVRGTDDAPLISLGSGSVVEDDQPEVSGTLTASDIDNPGLAFVPGTQAGTYGTLTLTADGAWRYTLGAAAQVLAAGQAAVEEFTVTLTDGSTTTVTIDITGTDDRPLISAGTGAVIEDDRPTATGTLTASDIDNPALAFVAGARAGTYGTLTLQAGGAWSYTLGAAAQVLTEGQAAIDRFTVTLTDGSTTTVTIDITGTDDQPVAVADRFTTDEDTRLSGLLGANDTLSGDGGNVWALGSQAANGTVVVNADGSFSYTPNANFNGSDSFTYTLTDADGSVSTATVELTVNAVDDAPVAVADRFTTDEDTRLSGVLGANDTVSGDGGNLWALASQAANGTVVVNADGSFSYTPNANFNGSDSFTYTLTDGDGDVSTATVELTVNAVDDQPVAVADRFTTDEDTLLSGLLGGNDTVSGDGGNLWALASQAANGTVVVNADGSFSYTPNANFNGSDSFTYTLTDADGSVSTATVELTVSPVNDVPVAVADLFSTDEDTLLSGLLGANDTLSGDGGNVWALASQAANGTVVVNADGSFSYTPNANFNGSDSFTYTLTDADGSVSTATVELTVNAVDDVPVAVADRFTTDEDTRLSGLLGSNDTLSGDGGNVWALGSQAANGTVVVNADGSFSYTPSANFNGSDSFTYTLTDADGSVSTATVELTVNAVDDAPVAVADRFTTEEDTQFSGVLGANDTLSGDGGNLWALASQGANGTVVVNADGSFSYTPNANFNGSDSFTYTLTDADGDVSTATVELTVNPVDDQPVAVADRFSTDEDTLLSGLLGGNDTVSGDGGNVWALGSQAANGTVVVNADGSFSYTPNANFNGSDSFTYTLTDADGDVSTATVELTVNPVNDAPVAVADRFSTDEDTLLSGLLGANDTLSGDGGNLWALASQAANGTVVVNADGSFSYTPNANFNGSDSFTYTLTDADGSVSTATVELTVNAVDDQPVAVADRFSTDEDTLLSGLLGANDTLSGDGGNLWALASQAANGTVVVNADGSFSYTPNANFNGSDSFTYTLTDADGSVSTATVELTVNPVNDAPVAVADTATAREAGGVANGTPGLNPAGNLLDNDTDIDTADTRMVSAVVGIAAGIVGGATAGLFGTLTLAADGQYVYSVNNALPAVQALRDAADTLTDSFSYTTTDAGGLSSTTTLTVTISGANDAPVAVNDGPLATDEDTPLAGIVVLGNDSDVEGDLLNVSAASSAQGSVTVNADNTLSFTPNANFNGPATISYTISDGRGGNAAATVTVNVRPVVDLTATDDNFTLAEDRFVIGSVAGNDSTTSGGLLTYAVARTPANGGVFFNADGSFRYTPRGNYNGADSFEYIVTDAASGESLRRTVRLDITLVNDAPVVVGGAVATLAAVNEDAANPPGATIASLFTANFSNPADAGNATQNQFAGVAVVADASSALAGRWQYSTNGGTSWLDLGAVSDAAARVLGTADRLRFVPAADFNGNVPALNVRLLDNSLALSSGSLADVSVRGGTTPVSSGTVALNTRINAVNDAPVAPSAEITATEEGADVGPAITAPFDIDSPTITIRVTALPTIGEFYLKVGNVLTLVNVGDSLTAAEAASLYYRPPQDYVPGSDVGKLVYQVGDGQFTVTGEVRVNVLPVDDAPVARAGVAAGNEDGTLGNAGNPPVRLTLTGSDVDSPITAVTVTTLPANGLLFLADGVTRVVAGVALTPAQATGLLFVPNANFNGSTTLQFTVRSPDLTTADPNDTRDSAPATFVLNIRPVNDAPVVASVVVSAVEEGQLVALGIGAPTDIDDAVGSLLITVTELPEVGAVLLNANDPTSVLVIGQRISLAQLQALSYQPPADYDGQQAAGALVYEVTDNKLISTGSATINLRPINDSPVASEVNRKVADTSQPLAFELSGSDRDGNVVAFIITSLPSAADGRLVLADGSATTAGQQISSAGALAVRFEPAAGFNGTASFSYQVVDDGVNSPNGTAAPLSSAPVLVSLDYSGGGGAPDITVEVSGPEDSDIPFAAADVGEPGGLITLTDLPDHGSLTFPDGTPVPVGAVLTPAELEALIYTPDPDYNGNDGVVFSYQPPGGGAPQSGAITITVTPTPDLPVAVNDSVSPTAARQPVEDRPFNINVLANDFDPDAGETALLRVTAINGQAITTGGTVAVFSPGGLSWGVVTLLADGTLQFTPAANVSGAVGFDYTITDPTGLDNAPDGGTRNGSVSLNLAAVNDAPQALLPDSVSTNEDTSVTFNPAANDTDVDGDPLRVTDVEQAAHGDVVLNADGSVTYTPDKDYFGPDSYSYTVADGQGGVTTGTVNVTVRPVNDAPVAANTKLVTNEDTAFSGRLPVATDVEGDAVVYSAALAPANGTLVVNADGSYIYTPAPDYSGSDSFSYTVSDGSASNTYTVGVVVKPVNDAPVVVNRTLTVNEEDAPVSLGAAASDVDVRDRLTITVTGLPGTTLGTVLLNGAAVAVGQQLTTAQLAQLTYTAPADYNGVTPAGAFTYRVSDGLLTTNGSIVIDLKPVNDAPVNKVPLSTLAVVEDGSLAFTGGNKLSVSDVDAGSGAITVTLSTANGGLTLNATSGVTIGGNASGLVTLDGTLAAVNNALASLVFRPAANFSGATTINVLTDDRGNTGPGAKTDLDVININVTSVNDAPSGSNRSISLNEDGSHVLVRADFGFADAADSPANAFASVLVSPTAAGALRLDGNLVAAGTLVTVAQLDAGRLVFTPATDASGNGYASFGFQVRDNGGVANGGVDTDPTANTVTFDVLPVNDAPSGADKTLLPGIQDSVVLTVADFGFSDSRDTPANALQAVVVSTLPTSGRLELDGNAVLLNQAVSAADIGAGKLVFLPATLGAFKVDASLGFQVRDDGGTARSGVDTDATPNTLVFDFAAVLPRGGVVSEPASLPASSAPSPAAMVADVFAWSLEGRSAGTTAAADSGTASQRLEFHDLLGGHESLSLDHLLGAGSGTLPAGGRSADAGVADTRLLIEGIDIQAVLGMPGSAFEHPLMPSHIERSKLLPDMV